MRSSMIPSWSGRRLRWSSAVIPRRRSGRQGEQGVAPLGAALAATIRRATSASMGRVRGWCGGGCFGRAGWQFHADLDPHQRHPGCSPCPPARGRRAR